MALARRKSRIRPQLAYALSRGLTSSGALEGLTANCARPRDFLLAVGSTVAALRLFVLWDGTGPSIPEAQGFGTPLLLLSRDRLPESGASSFGRTLSVIGPRKSAATNPCASESPNHLSTPLAQLIRKSNGPRPKRLIGVAALRDQSFCPTSSWWPDGCSYCAAPILLCECARAYIICCCCNVLFLFFRFVHFVSERSERAKRYASERTK